MRNLLFTISILLVVCSCGTIKPLAPDLPPLQINSIPLPDSQIDVPVSIDLSAILNDAASKIPTELHGEGSAGPGQYRWQLQRQPFNLSISGNELTVNDAAHFSAAGYIKNPFNGQWKNICSCNTTVNVGIAIPINLLNNYSLSGNARLTQFDLGACNLNIFNFNLTPIIKPSVTTALSQALMDLNKQISSYNLRPVLQPAWDKLNQPVKIGDFGYIVLNPSAVMVGGLSGSGSILNLSAGVTAKPVFYLSDPGKKTGTQLPDLSGGTSGNGFNVNLDLHLDYKPLNDQLKNILINKRIVNGGSGYIDLLAAEVYGTGNNHLLIKVKFSGKQGVVPYHGLLYFTCMPAYDVVSGNFYISDLNFDVNTIAKLKEGPAVWILSSAIKKYLGTEIHFNVGSQINGLKDQFTAAINKPVGKHLTLAGTVENLSLQGILPTKDYILLRVSTAGKLAVKIN